jgi:hypothetical protein
VRRGTAAGGDLKAAAESGDQDTYTDLQRRLETHAKALVDAIAEIELLRASG